MAKWPYTTQRWQRFRRHKLRERPLCEYCLNDGKIEPAIAVDHIIPIKRGGDAYPPLDHLMSLLRIASQPKNARRTAGQTIYAQRHPRMRRVRQSARSEPRLVQGVREMIALNDAQLKTVMTAAAQVPHEKRDLYLQRVAAMLTLRGRGHFTDSDVNNAVKLALVGMVHEAA